MCTTDTNPCLPSSLSTQISTGGGGQPAPFLPRQSASPLSLSSLIWAFLGMSRAAVSLMQGFSEENGCL